MSDSTFDDVYDPVATPNPAYDDDFEPTPHNLSSWERRGLAQALLTRARARREAIADAFVDALLDGKLSLFRLLIDLEQAAVAGEAEAAEARQPTLAEILLPMLERERAEAAAARPSAEPAPEQAPDQPAEPTPARPMLVAPNPSQPAAPPQPGITNLNAAASRPCRSRARKLRQRTPYRPSQHSIASSHSPGPGLLEILHGSQQPQAARKPSYRHTIPVVSAPPAGPRRRSLSRRANHANQTDCTPYAP